LNLFEKGDWNMETRFLHMADIHLGFQQYGSEARYNDFAKAWFWCCDYAAQEQVDFVLIAGDLFHSQQPGPMTVMQAVHGLTTLYEASIPVFAVEGNHDRARLSDGASWLEFLDEQKLLKLLHIDVVGDSVDMWCEIIGDTRIFGLQYFGSSLPKVLAGIAANPPIDDYRNILMMHGGLEGEVPFTSNFSMDDLEPLKEHFDYLALGHIHKFYERDNWVYNPGSPEVCDIKESEHGRYIMDVTVDTAGTVDAIDVTVPSREFVRVGIDVSDEASAQWGDSPASLLERCDYVCNGLQLNREKPVLEITLTGTLPFPRSELDLEAIQERANSTGDWLLVRVVNKTSPIEAVAEVDSDASRPEIEFQVVTDIVDRDKRWNNHWGDITKLVISTKDMSLNGHDPAEIAHYIEEVVA